MTRENIINISKVKVFGYRFLLMYQLKRRMDELLITWKMMNGI